MKKLFFTFIIILSVSPIVHAQWTTTGTVTTTSNTVGIGTTTPSYPFQWYNTAARSTNSGSYADFGFDSYNNTNWQGSRLYFGRSRGAITAPLAVQSGDNIGWLDFYGHDGTTLQRSGQFILMADGTPSTGIVPGAYLFTLTGSDGVTRERMRINSSGNVGIGTSDTKGYKLGVNGGIIANSIVVKVYPWADYVFKSDYQLPSLTDVKTYIDQYHHLPEIPSEQEVAKDGINLGEMNKLLLKKVEELTLYLIEIKSEKEGREKQLQDVLSAQQEAIKKLAERLKSLENSKPNNLIN